MSLIFSPSGASERPARGILMALAIVLLGSPLLAEGDPVDLLPVVPASANAIVAIDVDSLLKTALADRHSWARKSSLEFAQRPVMVPSEASVVAIAASLDPQAELAAQWQVAIAQMNVDFDSSKIALREGGYVDRIGESEAIWTPSDCYIVKLPQQRLAIASPANRQLLAGWLDLQRGNGSGRQVSEYLRAAAREANSKTQIVMAIDLKDAIPPHQITEGIGRSSALFKEPKRAESWEQLLRGIVGVTLKLSVSTHVAGELRIDFSSRPLADSLVKPLIIETLDRHDLHLDEIEDWTATADDNALILKGRFTPEGMRRVGSLLQLPTTKFSDLEGVEPAQPGTPDYVQRSQMYFQAVSSLIDDLNKTLKQNRDNHAVWMERYGQKVDALPILNVDAELLDWGASVSETFRSMAIAQRGAGIRQGVRKSSVYRGYYDYGGDYYVDRPVSSQKNEIEREEQARASKVRFESWKELEDSRSQIRRAMTTKYNLEF